MTLTHLTPADYVTTQWSGGATTQLAIAPKGAVYADRDFLWRLSSATVELDESDFTPLPAYDRVISTLRGDMVLAHNGGERLTLHPYEIHDFSGADDTHSWGRCTDFNLMLRRGQCRGCVTAHFPHGTETLALHAGETALLFCGEGSVTLRAGTETLTLAAHESALIEDAPAQLAVAGAHPRSARRAGKPRKSPQIRPHHRLERQGLDRRDARLCSHGGRIPHGAVHLAAPLPLQRALSGERRAHPRCGA